MANSSLRFHTRSCSSHHRRPRQRRPPRTRIQRRHHGFLLLGYFLFGVVLVIAWIGWMPLPLISQSGHHFPTTSNNNNNNNNSAVLLGPCAINLYGLPRSFRASVLPSLIRHVIRPNAGYGCDYYVHFDTAVTDAFNGRSDRGGALDPTEILSLKRAVLAVHRENDQQSPLPTVVFCNTTPAEFQQLYRTLLHRLDTETTNDGRHLIFQATAHESYTHQTIVNIIKMWHSQRSVWNLMERNTRGIHYSRVALLRSDVVYMTPVDVYDVTNPTTTTTTRHSSQSQQPSDPQLDTRNEIAIVPTFARFPVNDRMMMGPYDALQIWAAGRFARLDRHAAFLQRHPQYEGDGLHSERFLHHTLFPAIRRAGIEIRGKASLCFLRVRADHSVRLSDCGKQHVTSNNHRAVEALLQRRCIQNWTLWDEKQLVQLDCPLEPTTALVNGDPTSTTTTTIWTPGCDPTLKKNQKKKTPCAPEHTSLVISRRNATQTDIK